MVEPPRPPPLLAVEGLTVRFGGLVALDRVSFEVERGAIFSIVGPNGSGKSTAFDCICGLRRPVSGTVLFDGETISGLPPHGIARRGVARTFQGLELLEGETVVENLMLGRHRHMTTGLWTGMAMLGRGTRAAREERWNRAHVDRITELLGLAPVRERPVRELPHGTRKRVELGRALAMEPELLLLDEPSSGMGESERQRMADILRTLRADLGVTIVLIEHHLPLALGLADEVLALGSGRPIAHGTPDEVRHHPAVIEAWLGHA